METGSLVGGTVKALSIIKAGKKKNKDGLMVFENKK